ncbi:hypothetical protein D3C80_1667590 [compost metagenome]
MEPDAQRSSLHIAELLHYGAAGRAWRLGEPNGYAITQARADEAVDIPIHRPWRQHGAVFPLAHSNGWQRDLLAWH